MAIVFNCPFCQDGYLLMDDLAGRTAISKNCRQKIVIPNPNVSGDTWPPAPPPERADSPDGESPAS